MTPLGQGRSPTALDLLFGPAADVPATLAREILSAGGDQSLDRALGSLSAATREAAVREAVTVAAGLLQADLIGVLVAGWREHRDIVSAARRTLAVPGRTELVSMVTHEVTMAQQPSVNVLVDGRRLATLQLGLSIVLDVNAVLAGISGGRLVNLHAGRCDITVTLAVQGTDLLTRRAHFELPGVVPLRTGIRLLPAGEYPAEAHAGTEQTGTGHAGRVHPAEGRDPLRSASMPWWQRAG